MEGKKSAIPPLCGFPVQYKWHVQFILRVTLQQCHIYIGFIQLDFSAGRTVIFIGIILGYITFYSIFLGGEVILAVFK